GALGVVAALLLGLIGTILFAVREAEQRSQAEDTAQREIRARRQAAQHRQKPRRSLYVANVRLPQAAWDGTQAEEMTACSREARRDGVCGCEWYCRQRPGRPKVQPLEGPASEGVAFSPDGQRLALAGTDGTVRVWETVTGKELFALKGHDGGVLAVAFSPDG